MSPYFFNLFCGKEKAAKKVAIDKGNLIELVIADSLEREEAVELSLKSGKSYIGFILKSEIMERGEFDVALIPIASGYRDKDTHMLKITTNYAPTIEECLKGDSAIPELLNEDFRIVFPDSEISSVRMFYPEVYRRFQKDIVDNTT